MNTTLKRVRVERQTFLSLLQALTLAHSRPPCLYTCRCIREWQDEFLTTLSKHREEAQLEAVSTCLHMIASFFPSSSAFSTVSIYSSYFPIPVSLFLPDNIRRCSCGQICQFVQGEKDGGVHKEYECMMCRRKGRILIYSQKHSSLLTGNECSSIHERILIYS